MKLFPERISKLPAKKIIDYVHLVSVGPMFRREHREPFGQQ
jgi:hypothetical protein